MFTADPHFINGKLMQATWFLFQLFYCCGMKELMDNMLCSRSTLLKKPVVQY